MFKTSIVALLLAVASSHCFAMLPVADVTKQRAKELGVEIQSSPAGTNQVNVTLRFKTTGEFKNFRYAQLEIGDGERLVLSATLQPQHPQTDTVEFIFAVDHAMLPKCTVMIGVYDHVLDGTGYLFKLKDFIELEKTR